MAFSTRRVGLAELEITTLGLGYFDTSPDCGYGRSEHLVADRLRDLKCQGLLETAAPVPT